MTTEESVAASHELAAQIIVESEETTVTDVPEPPSYGNASLMQDRMDSIHVTNVKNRVLKDAFQPGVGEYAILANISNQIALSHRTTTSVYKKQHGIPARYSIPDVMNSVGLCRRTHAEAGMGLWLKAHESELRGLTQKERVEKYEQRREQLQIATDIFDCRVPQLLSLDEGKQNKAMLAAERKAETIGPSSTARNLVAF